MIRGNKRKWAAIFPFLKFSLVDCMSGTQTSCIFRGVVEAGLYGVCMVFYGAVMTNLHDLTTVSFVVTAG
jgi:hypothetical protein